MLSHSKSSRKVKRGDDVHSVHLICLVGIDEQQLHFLTEQTRRIANADGSLLLVASAHPHLVHQKKANKSTWHVHRNSKRTFANLDAGIAQLLDALGHALLKSILNGRDANQLQIAFILIGQRLQPLLALDKG